MKKLAVSIALLASLIAATSAQAQKTGSGRELSPARCDEFRAAHKSIGDTGKFRGKISIKFLAQLNAYMASNCTRPLTVDFDPEKEDRAYFAELMAKL